LAQWQSRNEAVQQAIRDYDEAARRGQAEVTYRFDHQVLHGEDLDISRDRIRFPGAGPDVTLDRTTPYQDMLD